jgi:hypothetical protein
MSKRLQVVVADDELERYSQTADAVGLTMSEWVRQTLRKAERETSSGDVEAKLAAIRKAVSYNFPASPDIETMLAETEVGYLAEIEVGMPGTADA